ncbi:glycosyl transferase [Burkholderia cepacia]|uniref:glycosyl transferase n=1 Tax=Burkholderia cepacia TaxID=292 RepID=UPI00075FAA68|nr:glycosyl transferase [Burkholderia cepacia]KWC78741.1 glycosyl transferase [Burkholderia cepacia]TEU32816.1 glycosyl transferase [Burkholderia cepacia]TEU67730.1 glycosyl transferase [Burkholderia cepacia]TEU70813.1 glycosyl transferase [Burkholderia cepacia]TEU75961.1 glycosyl transferase [Burkholderia cepacia]
MRVIEQLVYLSPVPWSSFAQRPHKFVEWFHQETHGRVLWIDPYPTRLPMLQDLRRPSGEGKSDAHTAAPPWLDVVRIRSLPLEPLPLGTAINRFGWRDITRRVVQFCAERNTLLAVGKPSGLALDLLRAARPARSLYDRMDDFPSFYRGVSRSAMKRTELAVAREVDTVFVSSSGLRSSWSSIRPDAKLVHNGLDPAVLPAFREKTSDHAGPHVLGYLGTMGPWFDWQWLAALAQCRPADTIRLIGPLFHPPQIALPENVQILPPLKHAAALAAMSDFDVGLIPFLRNPLTDGVDPIKYYEYRALGLPVISTPFGEMATRRDEPGTFLSSGSENLSSIVVEALEYRTTHDEVSRIRSANSWAARFAATGILG